MYVEELIGPDTVDTIPPVTLDAFRDHGEARASLESVAATESGEPFSPCGRSAAAKVSVFNATG